MTLARSDGRGRALPVQVGIIGHDHQHLQLAVPPDGRVVAEPSAFLAAVGIARLSAATALHAADGLLATLTTPLRWIGNAFGRLVSGERLFAQVLHAPSGATITLANPRGGQIHETALTRGRLIVLRRGAWIAHVGDIQVGAIMVGAFVTAVFARMPWLWQMAEGDGMLFFGALGHVVPFEVQAGRTAVLDPTAILGWQGDPKWRQLEHASVRGLIYGGEGLAWLIAEGPCTIWVDSGMAPGRGPASTARGKGTATS